MLGLLTSSVFCEQVIQSIAASVGGGNFTYYSLTQEGTVTLILDSKLGDADIYVSETNSKPDYMNYDIQSATCGQDLVTIPKDYKRPIGIGIYGHVYHPLSKYVLTVVLDYDWTISKSEHHFYSQGEDDNGETPLWLIFVNILKIVLEILV